MAVAEGVAFFVSYRFQELVDPDRGVHGESLFVQRFELDGTRAGLHDSPEAGDAHVERSVKEWGMVCWEMKRVGVVVID